MTSVAIAMCIHVLEVVHNFCNPHELLLRLVSSDALVQQIAKVLQQGVGTKPGLWTLDWTMD